MSEGEGNLESFVEQVCGEDHLRVEDDLGDGFVRLRSSEAERRQAVDDIRSTEDIVLELFRNSRDAHAANIYLAATREGSIRRLVMVDDGEGVPPRMHERIFEPRVTSKLDTAHMDKWGIHGRGMALYSVSVNAKRACVMASDTGKGSSFFVETDLDELGEKADQSSFPSFELSDGGTVTLRGPRNILRTACEFAIESRDSCSVYLGSATDVAATLYAQGLSSLTSTTRAFCRDSSELPVAQRLSVAADPAMLAEEAAKLGLDISERSARRIMDGEISPLKPLLDKVEALISQEANKGRRSAPSVSGGKSGRAAAQLEVPRDERGLKISPDDMASFKEGVARAFSDLAEAYYLEGDVEPEVKVGSDAIRVSIPIERIR